MVVLGIEPGRQRLRHESVCAYPLCCLPHPVSCPNYGVQIQVNHRLAVYKRVHIYVRLGGKVARAGVVRAFWTW